MEKNRKSSDSSRMNFLMAEILANRYNDFELEKKYALELLELAKLYDSNYCLAFAYTFLADSEITSNNIKACLEHLKKAYELCKRYNYTDLLMRANNFSAICYETNSDEHSAFRHYLRALTLARKSNNLLYEAILLNNIASNFVSLEEYNLAEKYYNDALKIIKSLPNSVESLPYIKLRIFDNCVKLYIAKKNYIKAKKMLLACETIDNDSDFTKKELLLKSWCAYYVAIGEADTAEKYAIFLYEYLVEFANSDKYLSNETLLFVLHYLISAGKKDISKKYLDLIEKHYFKDKTSDKKLLEKLKVQYCEAFGTEKEKEKAYYKFYKSALIDEKNAKKIKSLGLKNVIDLEELNNSLYEETVMLNEKVDTDELTGLFNRRYFNNLIESKICDKAVKFLAVIMIDVDYFKGYNDSYGHTKGDMALKTVADILKYNASNDFFVSRYGGDEFAVICVNKTTTEIEDYIKEVRNDLAELSYENKGSKTADILTLSIGFSNQKNTATLKSSSLINKSDEMLYLSKKKGRNTYSF